MEREATKNSQTFVLLYFCNFVKTIPICIFMQKVAFHTLGCKLNFSETSTLSRMMNDAGFETVGFQDGADIIVINTCSVTENANKECRYIIRKVKRISPDSKIIITGCYAQLKPKEISEIPGVDLVLGANEKFKIIDYLLPQTSLLASKKSSELNHHPFYVCGIEKNHEFHSSYSLGDRTRSFLKVQDGCDYTCSYCTIPLARGKSRSDSIKNVIAQSIKIAASGVKEIVLTGINLGDFRENEDNQKQTFFDLITMLDKIEGIERFRISSIEPNLLTDEIIEFVAQSKKFMPHFHIPLQSGSNKILKLMRRRYLRELYQERVETIKKLIPHCCIGADVIVGFPSESDGDFSDTCQFINQLDVSYLHVFTYSERENTDALKINEVVPINERFRRNKILTGVSREKKRLFYKQYLGTSRKILFEQENIHGFLHGFTENYIRVAVPFNLDLIHKIKEMELIEIDQSENVLVRQTAEIYS